MMMTEVLTPLAEQVIQQKDKRGFQSFRSQMQWQGANDVCHVQVLGIEPPLAAYCHDAKEAFRVIRTVKDGSVYMPINQVKPPPTWAPWGELRTDQWINDSNIQHLRVFMIDLDPRRASNTSSTDAELMASIKLACRVYTDLSEQYDVPTGAMALACSGNGAHLWIKLDRIPPTDETRDLLRLILARLDAVYSNEIVAVDKGNFDPKRIGPVFGLVKHKGQDTALRPHRRSWWAGPDEATACLDIVALRSLFTSLGCTDAPPEGNRPRRNKTNSGYTVDIIRDFPIETVLAHYGLEVDPPRCLWCRYRPKRRSDTGVEIIHNTVCCRHGTCAQKSASPAQIVAKVLWNDDDPRPHMDEIKQVFKKLGARFPPTVDVEGDYYLGMLDE